MKDCTYSASYFTSGLFDQDYDLVAQAIMDLYEPSSILDVGCGPGYLSRALATRGARVVALDGFAEPNFSDARIVFHRCNLNSAAELIAITRRFEQRFDIAVCLEVAEHLNPEISDELVQFLCAHAPVVVFSAAVPGQGGTGHINCQPRETWHDRFTRHGFELVHRVRPRLIGNPELASWYRFNIVDYAIKKRACGSTEIMRSLLAAESAISTELYARGDEVGRLRNQLRLGPVRFYLYARSWLKGLVRSIKLRT